MPAIPSSESKRIWEYQWRRFTEVLRLKVNDGVIDQILKTTGGRVKGLKILELGAGSGSDVVVLSKMGAKCTALDFSKNSLKVCRTLAKKEKVVIKTVLADCRNLPFASNTFDLVFSVGLVEHFTDPNEILSEQKRVLKRGGYLIVDVPQKYNLYTLMKKYRMRTGSFPFGWETEYSVGQLRRIASDLRVRIIRFYGRESAFTQRVPAGLQDLWSKYVTRIEKSVLAPFICLNIGMICRKASR